MKHKEARQQAAAVRRKARAASAPAAPQAPAPPPVEEAPWPDPQAPGHAPGVSHRYVTRWSDEDGLTLVPGEGRFCAWWVIRGDGSTQRDEREVYSGTYTVKGDQVLLQADTVDDEEGSRPSDRLITFRRDQVRTAPPDP